MKRYIKSSTDNEVSGVWDAIPEKYQPYIDEIRVDHPYSQYQHKTVTTYSAFFTNDVIDYYRNTDVGYLIGLIHCEDMGSLLSGIEEYLDPFLMGKE